MLFRNFLKTSVLVFELVMETFGQIYGDIHAPLNVEVGVNVTRASGARELFKSLATGLTFLVNSMRFLFCFLASSSFMLVSQRVCGEISPALPRKHVSPFFNLTYIRLKIFIGHAVHFYVVGEAFRACALLEMSL